MVVSGLIPSFTLFPVGNERSVMSLHFPGDDFFWNNANPINLDVRDSSQWEWPKYSTFGDLRLEVFCDYLRVFLCTREVLTCRVGFSSVIVPYTESMLYS